MKKLRLGESKNHAHTPRAAKWDHQDSKPEDAQVTNTNITFFFIIIIITKHGDYVPGMFLNPL